MMADCRRYLAIFEWPLLFRIDGEFIRDGMSVPGQATLTPRN
jgi:hypothetical protein